MVLAMPDGLLAYGIGPTALAIDCEEWKISFITPSGGGVSSEFNLPDLALIAARLPDALIACCDPTGLDNGGQIVGGIHVSQLRHRLIELRPPGPAGSVDCTVCLPLRQALQFVAEVAGLLARRVEAHELAIAELNQTLAQPVEAQA
jgi:hypothetical protein